MARPKIYDYDPVDDIIENNSIEGFRIRQVSFMPHDGYAVIVLEQGYIAGAGDEIVPAGNQNTRLIQINIDADGAKKDLDEILHPETFAQWYVANKQLFDDMHTCALNKAAEVIDKTGVIIST